MTPPRASVQRRAAAWRARAARGPCRAGRREVAQAHHGAILERIDSSAWTIRARVGMRAGGARGAVGAVSTTTSSCGAASCGTASRPASARRELVEPRGAGPELAHDGAVVGRRQRECRAAGRSNSSPTSSHTARGGTRKAASASSSRAAARARRHRPLVVAERHAEPVGEVVRGVGGEQQQPAFRGARPVRWLRPRATTSCRPPLPGTRARASVAASVSSQTWPSVAGGGARGRRPCARGAGAVAVASRLRAASPRGSSSAAATRRTRWRERGPQPRTTSASLGRGRRTARSPATGA